MSTARRTVLVTGAAGALGQAVSEAFRAQGAQRVLVDREQAALDAAFAGRADTLNIAADLLDRAQVDAAVAAAIERFGRIDVLCHLVGGFVMGEPVHETRRASWEAMFDINVQTLLHVAGAVVPHMIGRGSGRIVTVGAASAARGAASMGAYCAAKSAAIRLTESMSAELREHGINVNCVLPTIIDTPANRAAMPQQDASRWVAPGALADVIVFLASDGARAIHGAALPVSGLS